jgi:hypothetical protein
MVRTKGVDQEDDHVLRMGLHFWRIRVGCAIGYSYNGGEDGGRMHLRNPHSGTITRRRLSLVAGIDLPSGEVRCGGDPCDDLIRQSRDEDRYQLSAGAGQNVCAT